MRPRINVLTLGVDDLERSLAFYRDGMGLDTDGIIGKEFEDGAIVLFKMKDDFILALYPTASLAKDAKVTATKARLGAASIGQLVKSKAEVDAGIRPDHLLTARISLFSSGMYFVTTVFQMGSIFSHASTRSAMILEARNLSRRWMR